MLFFVKKYVIICIKIPNKIAKYQVVVIIAKSEFHIYNTCQNAITKVAIVIQPKYIPKIIDFLLSLFFTKSLASKLNKIYIVTIIPTESKKYHCVVAIIHEIFAKINAIFSQNSL